MAAKIHGRLGAAALAATTDTALYVVPAARKATCTLNLCNRTASSVTVRVALIDGALGALATEDYIEYDTTLPPGGTLERTGITLAATHTLMVRASAASVSAVVWGVEEEA
jgi:hypothetical protein